MWLPTFQSWLTACTLASEPSNELFVCIKIILDGLKLFADSRLDGYIKECWFLTFGDHQIIMHTKTSEIQSSNIQNLNLHNVSTMQNVTCRYKTVNNLSTFSIIFATGKNLMHGHFFPNLNELFIADAVGFCKSGQKLFEICRNSSCWTIINEARLAISHYFKVKDFPVMKKKDKNLTFRLIKIILVTANHSMFRA